MHDDFPVEPLVKTTAKTLLEGSIAVAAEINDVWPAGKDRLSIEAVWAIQTELLWYLLAVLTRYIPRVPGGTLADRDCIQDDLVSEVINQMLDSMYDWERVARGTRPQKTQALLDWYNEAEMDYGVIVREDLLAFRLAQRTLIRIGEQGNILEPTALHLIALKLVSTLNLAELTVALVKARRATRDMPGQE
jgi:hypothetical protein